MKQETLEAIKKNTETLYNHYKKGEISKEEILELRQEAIDDEEYEVAVSIKKVLDTISLEERVEWIALIHKQNLNGRETEDELFEAGILAGIEETKEIMYSEEELLETIQKITDLKLNEFQNLLQLLEFKPTLKLLTEELLLDLGFQKLENNWKCLDLIFAKISWERLAGLTLTFEKESIYLPHIKYLHEVQNLYFSLTGEKLTIIK